MKREAVKLKEWPFIKGEKARLIWIGEPFKQNNKWMVDVYFKGEKSTKRLTLDWASSHFLVVDKYYIDGNLNNGEFTDNRDIVDINLTGAKVDYSEKQWEVWWSGPKLKTKSKAFSFFKKDVMYVIPIIEIIRSVLAPDRFLLNRILEMDTLENYFIYKMNPDSLSIHFTSEYNKKLLKSEKINHLAWLLTNPNVFKMFNMVGQNMWQNKELKLEFLLNRFSIKARIEKHEKYTKVLEVVGVTRKRINVEDIKVYHPSLEETEVSGEIKKRKYLGKGTCGEVDLTSGADGATKTFDEINTFLISHEYESVPRIKKLRSGRRIRRNRENEITKPYIIDSGKSRTTADEGGQGLIKGLEFTTLDEVKVKGELEGFIEVLKLLEKRPNIKKIEIIVGELPVGRKFSWLRDEITRRKYVIGKIAMVDGRECSLIEVERGDKSLSMLLLKVDYSVNWKGMYSIILNGLIDESGKWSRKVIDKITKKGIIVFRNKHVKKSIYEQDRQIYNKIIF